MTFLENEKKVTCVDDEEFSLFWKCEINSIQIDNVPIYINTKIIFDSGTNGIVFPFNYLEIFNNIIKNNKFLIKNKCSFKDVNNDDIYKFVCDKKLNVKNMNDTECFFELFLDKSASNQNNNNSNSFGFKLIDLMDIEQDFSLYIFNRKEEILLGAPFFEKFPIMFNKDNNVITIFGVGNNLYQGNKPYKNKIKTLIIITIVIIVVLILFIVIREKIFSKNRINNSQIDTLEEDIQKLNV